MICVRKVQLAQRRSIVRHYSRELAQRQDSHTRKDELRWLREIEKKLIWLSTYTVHNANNIRPKRDGLKVGGHQASSTSLSTVMTALYCKVRRCTNASRYQPPHRPLIRSCLQ